MQINTVVLAGRLAKDVDYKATDNGTPIARFTLANTRKGKVQYFIIVSFGKVADYCHKYLKKGERVTVQGRLNHHERKNKDGSYNDYYTIVASTFDPIHRKPQDKSERDIYSKLDSLTAKVDHASKVGVK